jgi:hypothetical protein
MIDRGRPRSADQQDGTAYNAQENQNDRDLRADQKRICLRLGAIGMINQFALRLTGSARLSRWSHDRDHARTDALGRPWVLLIAPGNVRLVDVLTG